MHAWLLVVVLKTLVLRSHVGATRGSAFYLALTFVRTFAVPVLASEHDPRLSLSVDGNSRAIDGSTTGPALLCPDLQHQNDREYSSAAWACLRKSSANLCLRYPADAETHFNHIHKAVTQWSPGKVQSTYKGHKGPYVEDAWLARCKALNQSRCMHDGVIGPCRPLHTVFGPVIPLMITWLSTWLTQGRRYRSEFLAALRAVLRPDVPYATVVQNDEGLFPKSQMLREFPNILVFSAGGYGHVPVPLLLSELPLSKTKPPSRRSYRFSYVGSLDHAPGDLRRQMAHTVKRMCTGVSATAKIYHGSAWDQVMADSVFSLVPRGFGRTSFHLAEVIQSGLIPIHVYNDVPWVPYRSVYRRFGYITNLSGLPGLIKELLKMPLAAVKERENQVARARGLWTLKETAHQIHLFLIGKPSHLECQDLPPSVRGADEAQHEAGHNRTRLQGRSASQPSKAHPWSRVGPLSPSITKPPPLTKARPSKGAQLSRAYPWPTAGPSSPSTPRHAELPKVRTLSNMERPYSLIPQFPRSPNFLANLRRVQANSKKRGGSPLTS